MVADNYWGFTLAQWKRNCPPSRRCQFNPWVEKIPWRRAWQPIPVSLPGKSHGQGSLVGYIGSQRVRRNLVTELACPPSWLLCRSLPSRLPSPVPCWLPLRSLGPPASRQAGHRVEGRKPRRCQASYPSASNSRSGQWLLLLCGPSSFLPGRHTGPTPHLMGFPRIPPAQGK